MAWFRGIPRPPPFRATPPPWRDTPPNGPLSRRALNMLSSDRAPPARTLRRTKRRGQGGKWVSFCRQAEVPSKDAARGVAISDPDELYALSDFASGFGGGAGLLNTDAAVTGFFAALGFLGSRPLRFWPLAIAVSYGSHGVPWTGISVMKNAKHHVNAAVAKPV